MSSVEFISGSMFGKKSRILIDRIMDAHIQSKIYTVYKPTNDTRDNLFVKSRNYNRQISALPWDVESKYQQLKFEMHISVLFNKNIYKNHDLGGVFFDEAHFLPLDDMKFIIDTCKKYDIPLIMSGLEKSFKLNYFPSTEYLLTKADKYRFHHGDCNFCGNNKAVYNLLFKDGKIVKDGNEIQPGDEEYKVACENCLKEVY